MRPVLRQPGRRHVPPRRAAIARHVDKPVVGPRPDRVPLEPGGREREDGRVHLGAVLVERDRAAAVAERLRVRAREVGTDLLPRQALVPRAPYVLRPDVEVVGRDRGEDDRIGPVPAFRHVLRWLAHHSAGPRLDVAGLVRPAIEPRQRVRGPREEDVGLRGVRRHPAALAAADVVEEEPLRRVRVARDLAGRAGHRHRPHVLLTGDDVVGEVGGGLDAVQLRRRVPLVGPRGAAIHAHGASAVVADDHALRVRRIDPEIMEVRVGPHDEGVARAAVRRAHHHEVHDVDEVAIAGIGDDAVEVERPLPEIAAGVGERPGRAGVVGPVQSAGLRFDHGIEPPRVRPGDGDADLAKHARRQAGCARDLGPRVAAVGRLEEPGPRSAAPQPPRNPFHLPQRGVEHGRMLRIDHEIDGAGAVVTEQHLLPRPPAVAAPVHAARRRRPGRVAERGGVHQLRIVRIHADARDRERVGQTGVLPRAAAVDGTVDPVALQDAAAKLRLAHPDVDHVGIRGGHGDRPDRRAGDLPVRDGLPGRAAVGRLPEPPARRAEVVLERPGLAPGDGDRPAAAQRADVLPRQIVEDGSGVGRRRGRRQRDQEAKRQDS